jgi:ribosomal protein S12 methylthiotransferase accessory factor
MNAHAGKGYKTGTHRLVSPAETLARVQPLLPKMGITRLANVTGLDTIGIPVVMACRPNSRSISVSQGKGLDLDAAKASAVMESVEGYHAERITLPLKLASYRELRASHCVVDVERLPRAADSYFHPNLPILWIEGDDWLRSEKVWVPYQMVHTAYTTDLAFDLNCFVGSSTGLASGNHLLEASSHGICEVIERDAGMLWSRLPEPDQEDRRIDLDTIDHPDCRALLERYDRAGIAVAVWDLTSAAGIAAFHCLIAERQEDPVRRLYAAEGAGCHPVRHIALLRALIEAAQSRLTAISGARDDMPRQEYIDCRDPATLLLHRRRLSRKGSRRFSEIPSFESDSFEEDVAWELDHLRRAGFDRVIVIDLARPELGLPVARVVIPGLGIPRKSDEHSTDRSARGAREASR